MSTGKARLARLARQARLEDQIRYSESPEPILRLSRVSRLSRQSRDLQPATLLMEAAEGKYVPPEKRCGLVREIR